MKKIESHIIGHWTMCYFSHRVHLEQFFLLLLFSFVRLFAIIQLVFFLLLHTHKLHMSHSNISKTRNRCVQLLYIVDDDDDDDD